jgi:hypothetical protein
MTLARRLAAHFVAPADARTLPVDSQHDDEEGAARPALEIAGRSAGGRRGGVQSAVAERPPPAVALLAPPVHAPAVGAALGLGLARAVGSPVCLVCLWAPGSARTGWRAPTLPAAARLASTLRARGQDAGGSGRLVLVRLSTCGEEAATQAPRVSAAAGCVPTVLALAGPRTGAFESLLALQDLVVVALAPDADASLAQLAGAGLDHAVTCAVPAADPARALAAAGLVLLPSMRRALAAPIAALS